MTASGTSLCVIDVGTTSLRVAIVDETLRIVDIARADCPLASPFPGLVEFDAAALAAAVLDTAAAVLARHDGPVAAVGLTTQRASTVIWDRTSGAALAPALGWQDLRTVGECIAAKADHQLSLAPNQTATKAAWLLANVDGVRDRAAHGDVCVGTVDSWLAWTLTAGAVHVTDHTNAAVTGLTTPGADRWSERVLAAMDVPLDSLPRIVPSAAVIGAATRLRGAPPLAALVGDQQASLVGQGCVRPGTAKITFGTGGMLDACTGGGAPGSAARSHHGTFPIVAWSTPSPAGDDAELTWGLEAIMLSAGANVEWLCDDLGLIATPADSDGLAASVADSNGAVYVPAPVGLGTPHWDFGARGTLLGATRGTTAAHVARAVLDGVAHRGADLVTAAEADLATSLDTIRVDGGMSGNATFVQALADLTARPIEVSPVVEATTLGAAILAGAAIGIWPDVDAAVSQWRPARVVEPATDRSADRARWPDAIERAAGWIPELSVLEF